MTIVWDVSAKLSFKEHILQIAEDSIQNADMVMQGILLVIDGITEHPEKFPLDRFKTANDGSYRAFEKYNLRVAYLIEESQIRILRVRHVRQEPQEF